MLVMFLACIVMSWVGVKMQQARRQKEAVAIKKLGGVVFYGYQVTTSEGGYPVDAWESQYRGYNNYAHSGCTLSLHAATSLRMSS